MYNFWPNQYSEWDYTSKGIGLLCFSIPKKPGHQWCLLIPKSSYCALDSFMSSHCTQHYCIGSFAGKRNVSGAGKNRRLHVMSIIIINFVEQYGAIPASAATNLAGWRPLLDWVQLLGLVNCTFIPPVGNRTARCRQGYMMLYWPSMRLHCAVPRAEYRQLVRRWVRPGHTRGSALDW